MEMTPEQVVTICKGDEEIAMAFHALLARNRELTRAVEKQAGIIAEQSAKIVKLEKRIGELERQLGQNSSNSSKPPSSDGYKKPAPKSLRGKSGKQTGGQPGHAPYWLKMTDHPDVVEIHAVEQCENCQQDLRATPSLQEEKRQVFDVVMKRVTTEHRIQTKRCPHPNCGHSTTSAYPAGVERPTQYGASTRALLSYLHIQQLLPLNRISEMIHALTGHALSEGAILRANRELYEKLAEEEAAIDAHLLQSPVLHSDESGVRVNGTLQWLHTACTSLYTRYSVHAKRGREAMDEAGLLPVYKGTSIHDGHRSYPYYPCQHGLCNEHHHRELQGVLDQEKKQGWASSLISLLYEIKHRKESLMRDHVKDMPWEERAAFEDRYRMLIREGFAENPRSPEPVEKKRGKVKQTPTRNLLERLDRYRDATLAFMHHFHVPFTNNEAERAIRMIKNQQKVSGCFRSLDGAKEFARIRGFVSTLRKQGRPVLDMMRHVLQGGSVIAPPLAP